MNLDVVNGKPISNASSLAVLATLAKRSPWALQIF